MAPIGTIIPGTPVPYWVSQPVQGPDKTIEASTGNSAGASLRLAHVPDGAAGEPVDLTSLDGLPWRRATVPAITATTALVGIPQTETMGMFAVRMSNFLGTGPGILVNAPEIRWVRGDYGSVLEPGGLLTVVGSCLQFSGTTASAKLVQGSTTIATLAPVAVLAADRNGAVVAMTFQLPGGLANGDYKLYIHNGYGGTYGWTKYRRVTTTVAAVVTVAARTAWPSGVTVVDTLGGGSDEANLVLAIAATPAGGVLQFSAKTYTITTAHQFHAKTTLVGAGLGLTILHSTITSGTAFAGLQIGGGPARCAWSARDLTMEVADNVVARVADQQFTTEDWFFLNCAFHCRQTSMAGINGTIAINLRGCASGTISGCAIDSGGCGIFDSYDSTYIQILGCSINYRSQDINHGQGHSWLIRGNTRNVRGDYASNGWTANQNGGISLNAYHGGPPGMYCADVLYAGNTDSADSASGADLLAAGWGLTTDQGDGFYLGGVASVVGNVVNLSGTIRNDQSLNLAGALARICTGQGFDQRRKVLVGANGGSAITIDSPFDIPPDLTSTLEIISDLSGLQLVGNTMPTSPNVALYYVAGECLTAGNDFGVPGVKTTVLTWAGAHNQGKFPSARCQHLNNRAVTGTGVSFQLQASDSASLGPTPSLLSSVVLRDLTAAGAPVDVTLVCNGTPALPLWNVLIEDCDGPAEYQPSGKGVNYQTVGYRHPASTIHPVPVPSGVFQILPDHYPLIPGGSTMSDTLDSLVAYARRRVRGASGSLTDADLIDAVNGAFWLIASDRKWSFYKTRGYITIHGAVAVGTVTLTKGSASAVLSSGTWPTWAQTGAVAKLIASGLWLRIISATGLTATLETPWAEATVAIGGTVYQDEYQLPDAATTVGQLYPGTRWGVATDPLGAEAIWEFMNRVQIGTRYPTAWGVANRKLCFWPYPTSDELLGFSYYRAPAVLADGTDPADWDVNNRDLLLRAIDYQAAILFGDTATADRVAGCWARYVDSRGRATGCDGAPESLPSVLGAKSRPVPLYLRGGS